MKNWLLSTNMRIVYEPFMPVITPILTICNELLNQLNCSACREYNIDLISLFKVVARGY